MLDFDQLFKKILKTFFLDLLSLVRPSLAGWVLPDQIHFEDKELFTDVRQGERRLADLVARVSLSEQGETLVLTHVEVERVSNRAIGARMYNYNMQLQLRDQLPVLPVVVCLKGGMAGIHWRHHQVRVLDDVIVDFRYVSLGLSGMPAEQLLERPEPLAWALAAFARASEGRAWLKLECLRRIARAALDGVKQFLLVDAIETQLRLKPEEQHEFEQLLDLEPTQEVHIMELTWASELELRATERGMQKGMQQGIQQGLQQGMQQALQQLLTHRFGAPSEEVLLRVSEWVKAGRGDELMRRVLAASTVDAVFAASDLPG